MSPELRLFFSWLDWSKSSWVKIKGLFNCLVNVALDIDVLGIKSVILILHPSCYLKNFWKYKPIESCSWYDAWQMEHSHYKESNLFLLSKSFYTKTLSSILMSRSKNGVHLWALIP